MYCPSCGSENQADMKFCRRCGLSLLAASAAVTHTTQTGPDRLSEIVKNYYAGRDQMIRGSVSLFAGAAMLGILLVAGKWVFFWIFLWVFMALFGNGARQLSKGWSRWSEANSELKALGYHRPPVGRNLPPAAPALNVLPQENPEQPAAPRSVTESTTQLLNPNKR
jgi:zinc-ribbon domain